MRRPAAPPDDAVLVDALYGGKASQYIETQVKFEDGRIGKVAATLKIVVVPAGTGAGSSMR